MVTIVEKSTLHTIMVTFTVEPEEQEALVAYLQRTAREHSAHDGFVSNSIHRSRDGVRVVEYVQWRSREDQQAMLATRAARAHLDGPARDAEVHAFEVAAVVELEG